LEFYVLIVIWEVFCNNENIELFVD
jgi:hypothetical protein